MGLKLLLAAGGTGGHIWPAISLGRWISKNKPDVSVEYVCGIRQLEMEIYKSADIVPNRLQIEGSPLSGSILKKISRSWAQLSAFNEARILLKTIMPDCCILFGGYVSFPMLIACKMHKIPVVMHEQNAYAGKVTRFASKIGVDIFSGWSHCLPIPTAKYTTIGVPVREFEKIKPELAWKELGLSENMPNGLRIVVFSGSLGSQSIKDFICNAADKEEFKDWIFLLPAVTDKTEKVKSNVYLLPKIWNASLLFSLADMAVVRAGGSTLTEVGTLGIPSLVVPWRDAADDHQYHNAIAFLAENSAILWDGCGNYNDFEKKLIKLHDILKERRQITASKLYNSAGRICEDFWLGLSSHF